METKVKKKITVGIIGGTGEMGQWFTKFFKKNGCKVIIASRTTKLTCTKCASKADVVIISVPIDKSIEVIKKIAELRNESIEDVAAALRTNAKRTFGV